MTATERGSFQISFDLVQSWSTQILHFFASEEVSGATNLLAWVLGIRSAGTASLVWLLRKLRGSVPSSVEKLPSGMMRIQIRDETFDVPFELLRLYQDVSVRNSIQKLVKEPLKKEGIESFHVIKDGQEVESVSKSESVYFARPTLADETLVDEVRRSAFSILSLAFKEDNKWCLYDGNTQISATIEDIDFLHRVDRN